MEYQLEFSMEDMGRVSLRGQPDDEAIRMIREFEPLAVRNDPRGYCVCTSEGKDSRVLGHLMRRAGVRHFYLHSITGIDPPELVYFQRRNFQEYQDQGFLTYDIMYEQSIWTLMRKKKFPPLRQMRWCCQYLKERRCAEYGSAILALGVRKYESVRRAKSRDSLEIASQAGKSIIMAWDNTENRRIFETCCAQSEKRLNPLAYWPDAYIWDYSKEAGLEQCSLYQEGFHRLGCIGCPMAGEAQRKREFDRWPKFREQWIRSFDQVIQLREEQGLINEHENGQAWFDWWMGEKAQEIPVDENQFMIEDYF
nr:phosphoadenosine phosphosulfate reductase family protein [uncultured Oscillibacter sp.]